MEGKQELTDSEIAKQNIAKLRAKGKGAKLTGGKRVVQKKKTQTNVVVEDKNMNKSVARFDPKVIPEIEEVNMFRDDATVVHMRKPQVKYAFKEQLLVLNGNVETKTIKEMMPEILKQVGPKEFVHLNELIGQMQKGAADKEEEDEDDQPPELVGTFEDAAKTNN